MDNLETGGIVAVVMAFFKTMELMFLKIFQREEIQKKEESRKTIDETREMVRDQNRFMLPEIVKQQEKMVELLSDMEKHLEKLANGGDKRKAD